MKKFLIKTVVFLVTIALIDLALSHLLDYGRPEDYAAFVESKEEFDEIERVDILFIGDSETADGFIPSVFTETVGGTAFNFGVYQLSPFEGYYLLRDLIERKNQPPALVVLGTDVQMFHYNISEGRYSPLFIKNIRNAAPLFLESQSLGAFTLAGRKSYLFPGLVKKLIASNKQRELRREVESIENGYLKNSKHYSESWQISCNKDTDFFSPTFVEQQQQSFIDMIEYLRENRIDCVIANPPMHPHFLAGIRQKPLYDRFRSVIDQVAQDYQVPVFNENHDLLMDELEEKDFLDGDHLCYPGAMKFSTRFAQFLLEAGYSFKDDRKRPSAIPSNSIVQAELH